MKVRRRRLYRDSEVALARREGQLTGEEAGLSLPFEKFKAKRREARAWEREALAAEVARLRKLTKGDLLAYIQRVRRADVPPDVANKLIDAAQRTIATGGFDVESERQCRRRGRQYSPATTTDEFGKPIEFDPTNFCHE